MPSTCPKCRQVVAEDIVCCAELRYTWKCTSCAKLSTGFALPFGRCFLCGGTHHQRLALTVFALALRFHAAIFFQHALTGGEF